MSCSCVSCQSKSHRHQLPRLQGCCSAARPSAKLKTLEVPSVAIAGMQLEGAGSVVVDIRELTVLRGVWFHKMCFAPWNKRPTLQISLGPLRVSRRAHLQLFRT